VAERVLVISLQGVGNLIMATPVIEGLARAGRDVRVAVSTRAVADLISASPWVSGAVPLDEAVPHVTRGGRAAGLGLRLRRERFAASVTTYPNGRSAAILALAVGARARVGFAKRPSKRAGAYTVRLAPAPGLHDVEQNLRLLDALEVPRPAVVAPWVPLSDADRAFAEAFVSTAGLDAGRPIVALHPGGAATGLFRRWPRENFEELALRLRRDLGLGVALVGDASERAMLEGIARAAGDGVAVAAGPPLGHIAGVIAKCRAFVGNDSGPLHIAAALGVPVVGIYGPTNEVRTAPYGPGHTVLTAAVTCRPCYAYGERFSCEFDQVMCLELIDVDAVLGAVKAKLGRAV
jgi:lipopolysaccharide heptosyltransferase II